RILEAESFPRGTSATRSRDSVGPTRGCHLWSSKCHPRIQVNPYTMIHGATRGDMGPKLSRWVIVRSSGKCSNAPVSRVESMTRGDRSSYLGMV
ncbi:hypothetical protein HAX54_046545, partial [Datura stramonium]|nr:hypothetical protein [Datura stramonium]